MAVEFAKGTVGSRTSEYRIDPLKIIIRPELNGRHVLPEIDTLVADMLSKPDGHSIKGQTTPVIIRKDGDKPVLVAGHRRLRAILEINKRKLTPVPLDVRCSYMQITDEAEALAVAVTENRERAGITPIDEAFCIKGFLRLGKDHEWIALNGGFFPGLRPTVNEADRPTEGLKKAIAWVKKREKLLGLTEEGQKAVSDGKLKPSAAEHLADLEADKQRELLKKGATSGKDISKASGKTLKLTPKQVKEQLDTCISEWATAKGVPKELLDFLQALRDKI